MRILRRIHNSAYGWGFLGDDGARFSIDTKGGMTINGFNEFPLFATIDPDPTRSFLRVHDDGTMQSLDLHHWHENCAMMHRLMMIEAPHLSLASAIVKKADKLLEERAAKSGHPRNQRHG